MCNYAMKDGKCSITDKRCVWMYFCYKDGIWKPFAAMPDGCKQSLNYEKIGGEK